MNWKTGAIFVLSLGLAAAFWLNRDSATELILETKFEELEEKLEAQLPKDVGLEPSGDAMELILRPGPTVETPDGDILDVEAFAAWVQDSSELCQEHGVVFRSTEEMTYPEIVKVVEHLLVARVSDIDFGGVNIADPQEDR